MTEQGFWALIDVAREEAGGDPAAQVDLIAGRLEALPPGDILDFDRHLTAALDRSYDWGLWAAAHLINGGATDEEFEFFRCRLVSLGRDVFERALKDPESLADVEEPEGELEELLYAAPSAYEEVTGEELPAADSNRPEEPTGEPWEEEDLEERFPRLADRFG